MQVNVRFCLAVAVLLCLSQTGDSARLRRQGWGWDQDPDDQPSSTSTTTTTTNTTPSGGASTTPSQQYRTCLSGCPSTPQYNPVCGTDGVTYDNEGRLECAKFCGASVEVAFRGRCEGL